ncbi:MAG: hypothetical protein IKF96_07725, partial [Eggerthellaceae bacterium]|nr:hypothetical protein [Eggerthellaceae bacterium]
MCDDTGRLGIPAMLDLFMDVATTHAIHMGCGWPQMAPRHLFWLTVKTKAIIDERPRMGETFTIRTWPESPDKMRCNRSYEISQAGKILVRAKTEWAVLDTAAGTLAPVTTVYPEGLEFPAGVCPEPFVRVVDRFDGVEPFATYTVRSTDIDVGHHMNNVAYSRAALGSFSCAELAALNIHEVDCIFRNQCFEGDVLTVQKKAADAGGLDIRLATPEKTIFLMHLA